MSQARVDLILRQLDSLPALPAAVARVLESATRPGALREVVEALAADPALAERVLQLAQAADASPHVGEDRESALIRLGLPAIRSAVLAIGIVSTFPADHEPAGHSDGLSCRRADLWTHSLAVACAAELLAERLLDRPAAPEPCDAFCCGLLHDLGKLALQSAVPRSYARVIQAADVLRDDISIIERQVIGVDHNTAGRRLAERWHLPAIIRDVAWLHNQHPEALPEPASPAARVVNLVTLADQLARWRHVGYSGNYSFGIGRDVLLSHLDLTQADVEHVLAHLIDRMAPRSAALGLGGDAQQLYRQALGRTSQELDEAQDRLRDQSARHAARARCFEALAELENELEPEGSVEELLVTIAQTAEQVLEAGPVAAFSFAPGDLAAQVVLVEEGRAAMRGEPDREAESPQLPSVHPAGGGDGPVRPAGDDLEWLTSVYGPRLRGRRRWWLRLEGAGKGVGGIVWGGDEAEPSRLEARMEALRALCVGWSLALRLAQGRENSARAAEQLAEANRRLAEAQERIARDRTTLAIAELAAGAAHEMNNPLMVISGRSQLLAQTLTEPRQKQAALAVHENAVRLSEMITQLMRFASPDAAQLRPVGVEAIIAQALQQVHDLPERSGRQIELNLPQLPPVQVDADQAARAVAAVLENALQATADGSGRVEIHAAEGITGDAVVLTVLDNGTGMDSQTLRHAFEPFFSRKQAGRRRGMGLPVALRLIEANGGSLRLDSRQGAGTRAVIVLPRAPAAGALGDARRIA